MRRVAQRELVAEEAAPVVQQQSHRTATARALDHAVDQFDDLIERMDAARSARCEARQREADAAVVRLQHGDLRIPQALRIGPAVDQQDRLVTAPVDLDLDAVRSSLAACWSGQGGEQNRNTRRG
jgi:hypothetical protein